MTVGQRTKPESADTARRILEHARTAFNARGVMAVGVRDIARDLGLSPGNVSYHFATKEVLVTTLVENAHRENNAAVLAPGRELDFAATLELLRGIMRRDLENPWLMRDYVSLLVAFPALRSLNDTLYKARVARINSVVVRLIAVNLLDRKRTERDLPRLRLQILTQVFFWLPAATMAAVDRTPARSLEDHARAALALLLPYCTPAGRRQLEAALGRARAVACNHLVR